MLSVLFDLVLGTVVVYAFLGFLALAVLGAAVSLISVGISNIRARLRRQRGTALRWSRPADEIARALAAEQAVTFCVRWHRGVRARHLEFMLVPLGDLPRLERGNREPGRWQVFCPDISSACIAALPWNGRDLVGRLKVPAPDATAGAEALDAVMSRMVGLLWGAG